MPDDSPALDDLSSAVLALQQAQANDTPLEVGAEVIEAGAGSTGMTSVEEFQTAYVPEPEPVKTVVAEPEKPEETVVEVKKTEEEEKEPAEPVLHPKAKLPDGLAARYRLRALDELDALTMQVKSSNANMTLEAAMAEAKRQLGIVPGKGAETETQQQPQTQEKPQVVDPVAALVTQIAEKRAERAALNPGLDVAEFHRLTAEIEDLVATKAEAAAEGRAQQVLREREILEQAEEEGQQAFAAVAAIFPDLGKEDSEFALRFAELHNANVAADSPLLADKDYERTVATMVAGQLMLEGKTFAVNNKGGTAAPAPAKGTADTGTTTEGQPKPGAKTTSAASTASLPAGGVALIPGAATSPSSEHRVTYRQPNEPEQDFQQKLSQSAAEDDLLGAAAALGFSIGGGIAPGQKQPISHMVALAAT